MPNMEPDVPQNIAEFKRLLFASLSSIRSKSGCEEIGDMFHMGESVTDQNQGFKRDRNQGFKSDLI